MPAAEDFIQGFLDGPGKKIRTRKRTLGGHDVHEQGMFLTAQDTYYALANNVVPAGNKSHFALHNGSSAAILKVRKIFCINVQVAAATGAAVRFDFNRTTAVTLGTAIAPNKADSSNPNLANGIVLVTGGTAVEATNPTLFPFITTTEEMTATQAATNNVLQQGLNLIPEGPEIQELVLRPGEGAHMKQITAVAAGSLSWLIVFTQE